MIFRPGHSHLVDHIITSAESSLAKLCTLFAYEPSEKIVINTYDVNDYGAASTTTVPHNYIWLDIAPMEPGYENIPYAERLRWLISHELVHVVVNDLASGVEAFCRKFFSKVPPEQQQPLSVFFSLLTNYSRYTPRWHQEGIAVFLETWLNGGFGRAMGSFDEMYFRSMTDEGREFPGWLELETMNAPTSFLLETEYYVFGGRFASFLAKRHGVEKLVGWYRTSGQFYSQFTSRFLKVFGYTFDEAWQEFISAEREFQKANIERLKSAPFTPGRRIERPARGAVSRAHFDRLRNTIVWGEHSPHQLAVVREMSLTSGEVRAVGPLQTPSLFQVTSTAYDEGNGRLFFTTNNNQLYRDLWEMDLRTGRSRQLAENIRVGHLTFCPKRNEVWGIRHTGGMATLVAIPNGKDTLIDLIAFDWGTEVQALAFTPDGSLLAAVLHASNGDQRLVVVNADEARKRGNITSVVISADGSPENPAWSDDGRTLFWNAYTNGVSNIYRKNLDSGAVEAVTHTIRGYFRPVYISRDSLFAFEFSTGGFVPVMLPNARAERLPAITYMGQGILEKEPQLSGLRVAPSIQQLDTSRSEVDYPSLSRIAVSSFFPIVTGFQSQKGIGFQARLADLILTHDITLEASVTPFREKGLPVRYHWKVKYEYQKELEASWEHNATDFFDLFNARKRGTAGEKLRLAHNYFWVYDNPLKIKQQTEATLYANVTSVNDNLVPVSQPDFLVAQSAINIQSLRRSIGSVDFEEGNELNAAVMFFGADPKNWQSSINLYADWDHYMTWLSAHNTLHWRVSAGVHQKNERLLQSRFYFGGFGNRALENVAVKQYRKTFSLPGIPPFSLGSDRFTKLLLENTFPPLRFSGVSIGQHYASYAEVSCFAQGLLTASDAVTHAASLGAQVNIVFKHWFNLETTLSAGVAHAWLQRRPSDEWFVSFKLLKN